MSFHYKRVAEVFVPDTDSQLITGWCWRVTRDRQMKPVAYQRTGQPAIGGIAKLAEFQKKTGIEGTGLGLSIATRIVENHGGKLELVSGEDSGTTFVIILPLKG